MKLNEQNIIIYSLFVLIAISGIYYGQAISLKYNNLRLWQFENALILLIGIPFLLLQTKAGIPNFVEEHIQNKKRILEPIFIGAAFGLLDIIVIKIIQHPEPYTELPPFLQPFPYSIFLYLFFRNCDVVIF